MPEVHIWRTLAGVVALNHEAFGFSFCADGAEIAKLRADLEAGVPMNQAVGFSGSSCGFAALVRVESKENSPTVIVVARDFLGKAKEDFTFKRHTDREEFFAVLLERLGPGWKFEQASRGGWVLLIAPALVFGFSVFCLLCSGLLAFTPRDPNRLPDPKAAGPPLPEFVPWVMIALSFIAASLCVWWFLKSRKGGGITWETVCKR